MKAFEAKEDLRQKIRFEGMATFNISNKKMREKKLYLKLNELILGKVSPFLEQPKCGKFDEANECFVFPRFEFTSD